MNTISAKIVADSVNPQGDRITSFILTYPRFIHSELMTHRMFSRNSASSRAIPFKKMIKMVEEDPFIPIAWQKDHKGMQGTEYLNGNSEQQLLINKWLEARDLAVQQAKLLNNSNVTKQLCNRLLEPFMWHTVLVTATSYENFFELRLPSYKFYKTSYPSKKDWIEKYNLLSSNGEHNIELLPKIPSTIEEWLQINQSQAEIHIQVLAEAMWDVRNESTPKQLQAGQWHIPFGDNMDFSKFDFPDYPTSSKMIKLWNDSKIKIATARCARVSYMTFDGEINYEKDIKLHDHLLESYHMSPLEHCTRAMSNEEYYSFIKGQYPIGKDEWGIINYEHYPFKFKEMFPGELYEFTGPNPRNPDIYGWCNNFKGFIQYRYLIENNL
jgi:thymidylate synthase ThyX